MKKIIVAVLLTLLALSVYTCALADDVLLSSRDLSVTLLGTEIAYLTGKDGSETPYLSCGLSIENNTGGMIDFQGGNCAVNGVETDILTPSRVKTGTVQTDIMLMAADGGSADHLFACETIDFDLAVYTYDTEDVLYKFPVHIELEAAQSQTAAPAAGGPIDIISSSDLTVTITGAKMTENDEGVGVLQCQLKVDNGLGHTVSFSGRNCVINGVETKVAVPARANAGVSEKFLIFMPQDGQSAGYLRDIDSLAFDLEVRNSSTGEVVCDVPVYIGGDLPGMTQEAVPAQQEIKPPAESEPAEEPAQAPEGAMEPYMEDDALVIAHDLDFSVRLGGWELTGSGESAALRIYPVIENRSGRTLDFNLRNVTFDGAQVKGYGAYDVEPGTRDDDFFMFKDENGGTDRLMNADLLCFDLVVKDASTFDVVAEMPVVLSRDWLDMLYVGDTRNFETGDQEEDEPAEDEPAVGIFEPYMEDDTLVLMANEYLCLRLSGWEANLRDDGVTTRIYPIIENRTVRTLDFRLEDAYFDENPVDGYGVYDVEPGVCADDFFMFKDPNGSVGYELLDPDQISFKLVVKDSDNSSMVLTEAYMTLSGEWLDMLYEGDPRSDALEYAYEEEYEYEYEYESEAPAYQDACPLEIFDGAYIEWEHLSGDQLKIRVQVQNSSWNMSVQSFRINMYADDIWGNRLWEDGWVYYEETEKYVAAGATAYSDYFYVPDADEIGKVYFGISDVYCTNGREYHISDVDYWYWSLD